MYQNEYTEICLKCTDEIQKYAKVLETDPDPEIREHARRLM